MNLEPAIEELRIVKKVVDTNAPINERSKAKGQARLERRNSKSFGAAIKLLGSVKKKSKWAEMLKNAKG